MYDILIIGGGAAGFFAAIHIAEKNPELKIVLIERGKEVLTKVKSLTQVNWCTIIQEGRKNCWDLFIRSAAGILSHFLKLGECPLKLRKMAVCFQFQILHRPSLIALWGKWTDWESLF
mgnify:CR=1 FL=1